MITDPQAIGEVLRFDPSESRQARVIYLSSDVAIRAELQSSAFMDSTEAAAEDLSIQARDLAPGVVEISYNLERSEPTALFIFLVSAAFGHAIYL